jgi:hypothetical protein
VDAQHRAIEIDVRSGRGRHGDFLSIRCAGRRRRRARASVEAADANDAATNASIAKRALAAREFTNVNERFTNMLDSPRATGRD